MTNKQKLHTALERALEPVTLSETRRQAILAALEKGDDPMSRRQRALRTALIAAALCALLAAGALAVSPALRDALSGALGSFEPYSQAVEGVSCTDQGITLKVVRTLADENGGTLYLEAVDHTGDRLGPASQLEGFGQAQCLGYDEQTRTALFAVDLPLMWQRYLDGDGQITAEFTRIQPALEEIDPVPIPWERVTRRRLDTMTLSAQDCVECLTSGSPGQSAAVLVPNQTPAELGSALFTLSSIGFDENGRLHVQLRLASGVQADPGEIYTGCPDTEGPVGALPEHHTTFIRDGVYYKDICFPDLTDSAWGQFSIAEIYGRVRLGDTIEGSWTLTFPLELLPERVVALSEPINGQVVEQLSISATSLRERARFDDPDHPTVLGYQLSVYLSDGSVMTVPYGASSAQRQTLYRQADGTLSRVYAGRGTRWGEEIVWQFPRAIDPAQVTAIAIGQRYIPVGADNTGGGGYWLAALPQDTGPAA